MDTRQDPRRGEAGRRALNRRAAWMPAAAVLALAASSFTTGCGGDVATDPASPSARAARSGSAAAGVLGPPKSTGGVCERTTADRKSLPSWARITVERFVAAVDRGDREAIRALFDPLGADEVLADLRPVARLGLLALEDRY